MRAVIASPELNARYTAPARAAPFFALVRTLAAVGGAAGNVLTALAASPNERLRAVAKAAVAPGRSDGSTWGSQIAELEPAASAFVELVRQRTVLGRLTGFRRVPFGVKAPTQTAGSAVGWTAQGGAVQVSPLAFDTASLQSSKIGGIVVVSKELAALGDPDAQALIDADLTASTAGFTDVAFLDPSVAAANGAPASITNGAPTVAATGTTEAALKTDVAALVALLEDAGSSLENVVLVMSGRLAVRIAGFECGRDLSIKGGELLGLPVEIAPAVALRDTGSSPVTERIVAVDPTRIMLADTGVEVSASEQGTLQFDSAPDSPPTASTVQVSLWQANLVAVMVIRYVRWQAAGGGAAAYISGAAYGG